MQQLMFPEDQQFWFETLRNLGFAVYGGSDVGEVIATASRVTSGDYDSWYDAWISTAQRLETEARASRPVSARDGLLRASTYYRAAEFFLHGDQDDPRIDHAYGRGRDCFLTAAGLFSLPIEPVEIPYEDTVLHGYFYRAAGADAAPCPTMIMHSGFDGSSEELHHYGAAAGAERGYHVLTFDGPGQPAARHLEGLVFRPDWENVVTPVLDWLLTRPEVDAGRVGLLGLSMGGLLAPRAAAFEHRLAACVAVDGLYDLGSTVTDSFPGTRAEAEAALRAKSAPDVDAALRDLMATQPTIRWAATHGQYVTGAHSPRAFFATYLDYTLAGGIAEQISCPTLICDGEEDIFFGGQPQQLFDHLSCPKTLLTFPSSEGSGAHCHAGAQRIACARIYDWLDDTLRPGGAARRTGSG